MKKKSPLIIIVVIVSLALCLLCFLVSILNSSDDDTIAEKTITPTPTTLEVDKTLGFDQIESQYDELSKDDFEKYFAKVQGKRIHWIGKVTGGDEDTRYLEMGQKAFRSIYLEGISEDEAPEGVYVEFEAKINKYSRTLGFSLYLSEPVILQTLASRPTDTPVPTATDIPTDTPTSSPTPTLTNTASPTATSTPTPVAYITMIKSGNIRSGPGQDFLVVGGASTGNVLPVYGKNADGTWVMIEPVNYQWVFVSLGTLDTTIDLIPVAPTPIPTLTPTVTLSPTPTSTRTPIPSPTPIPSRTPIPPVLLETIYENYQTMTELQFDQYKTQIVGKKVHQFAKVGNVDDKGRVIVSGPWSPWIFNITDFCVIVAGVPTEVGLTINGGDEVLIDATINRIQGDYTYFYNCENTVVLYYISITK